MFRDQLESKKTCYNAIIQSNDRINMAFDYGLDYIVIKFGKYIVKEGNLQQLQYLYARGFYFFQMHVLEQQRMVVCTY